ncbi:hypothetical protein MMC20_003351 [Loxospora ochrophaea]|nr:hypothetical protein [Loxospora ochrophaea]
MDYLNIDIVTFNCGRELIEPDLFARHILSTLQKTDVDVLVLSLQEIAPIAYSFLGGSYLVPYFGRFHHAVELAASELDSVKYVTVVSGNVGMTAMMAFAREEAVENIRWLETAGVGVGIHEMGNKGAVGLRIGYAVGEETMQMTFVAAHLAANEEELDRRNEDWKNIVRGLVFSPVNQKPTHEQGNPSDSQTGAIESEPLLSADVSSERSPPLGVYTPNSHLFLAGDLNYRTSRRKPSTDDFQAFPQPTEDVLHPSHYSNLMKKDQLSRELKAGRTCHGLSEATIEFPPTYKFSNKQRAVADTKDESCWGFAKHRWPSWCDRVLFLDLPSWMKSKYSGASIQVHNYRALPLMSTSDHRPVTLSLSIPRIPIVWPHNERAPEDVRLNPPFAIDPEWKERRAAARRKEIAVGLLAYLGLTWEGNGLLLATLVGALGGWAVISNIV